MLGAARRVRFGVGSRGVAQPGQSIGLQNRGPRVRILPPLPISSAPAGTAGWGLVHEVNESDLGGSRRPAMSKQITTRWYIGAWVVAGLVGIAKGVLARRSP